MRFQITEEKRNFPCHQILSSYWKRLLTSVKLNIFLRAFNWRLIKGLERLDLLPTLLHLVGNNQDASLTSRLLPSVTESLSPTH